MSVLILLVLGRVLAQRGMSCLVGLSMTCSDPLLVLLLLFFRIDHRRDRHLLLLLLLTLKDKFLYAALDVLA